MPAGLAAPRSQPRRNLLSSNSRRPARGLVTPISLTGTIARINRLGQSGEIEGDDGKRRPFERESMVRWLQFNELRPGTRVTFEVEGSGRVINVERIDKREVDGG